MQERIYTYSRATTLQQSKHIRATYMYVASMHSSFHSTHHFILQQLLLVVLHATDCCIVYYVLCVFTCIMVYDICSQHIDFVISCTCCIFTCRLSINCSIDHVGIQFPLQLQCDAWRILKHPGILSYLYFQNNSITMYLNIVLLANSISSHNYYYISMGLAQIPMYSIYTSLKIFHVTTNNNNHNFPL